MFGKRISSMVNNIMYTERGRIILSIILGLGVATLFRRICEGKNCYDFIGPSQNELKNEIFSYDSEFSKCYMLNEETIECGSREKTVNFG